MHYYGDGWGGWIGTALWMILFWGGLIGLIVWAVTRSSRPSNDPKQRSDDPTSPQQILDARFARGEIDADEYRNRREVLAH